MNFSAGLSGGVSIMKAIRSSKSALSVKNKASSMGESSAKPKSKIPPKPEPLTDKQILKKINNEVMKSRVFNQINIRQLPDHIVHREVVDKNLFRKKKGGLELKQEEGLLTLEAESDGEAGARRRRVDYFLEKEVIGDYHISLARDAAFARHKDSTEWSGQDIMPRYDPYKARAAVDSLDSIRVWPYSVHGVVKRMRVLLKYIMNSTIVDNFMTLLVLGNTVVLGLGYYGAPDPIVNFCTSANVFFTIAFAIEMVLKITAIGPGKWLADKMNWMDGTIVFLSLAELLFLSGSNLGALRSLRIMRVFRILRVARLLRGLKMMGLLIRVIANAAESFMYLGMLLILFVFIYALLGMQLFGGNITDPAVVGTL